MAATFAGTPCLLRPPERFFGSSSAFSGSCLVMWLLSTTVMNRRDAVYGLKLFSPIAASYLLTANLSQTVPVLQVFRVLNHLFAFGELDVRFLPIPPVAFVLAAAAHLAHKIRGAHRGYLHLENLLHGFLDLRLCCFRRNFKDYGVLRLFHAEALFRDDRPPDNLIVRGCHRLVLPLLLCRLGGFLCRCRFLRCGFWRSFFFCSLWRGRNRLPVRHNHELLLRIERVAQPRHRILREHHQVMLQHVVRLQNAGRRQLHAIEIAAREFQVAVLAVRHQQRRLRVIQLAKHFDERLRLVRLERPGIHDRQLLLREFCRKRRAQCAQQHLLWQRIAVIARPWSVDRAAMTPERRPDRADAGASRTLLFPELATRATYFALFLDLVRAPAQSPQIPPRGFVQQVLIHLRAKDRVRQFDLADFLATQIDYIHDRHNLFSFFTLSEAKCRSALFRFFRLADENVRSAWSGNRSAHQQQVLVGVHLHYLQILGRNLDVAHVTRKVLVLPDARRERTAADAARRAMMHRTVRRVAAAVVPALDAALKPLALAHAADIHELAGLEVLHQHAVANLGFVLRFLDAHFLHHFHRRDIGLFEVAGHRLVYALRLDEFHEPQLRGLVPVVLFRPALHHHARARLKNGAPDERAVFDEHLRHAQLDSDNSVDRHCSFLSLAACLEGYWLRTAQDCCNFMTTSSTACPNALISTSTPGGKSSFISASTVSGVGSRMSISRL